MFNNSNVNKTSLLPLFHTKIYHNYSSYEIKVVVISNNENCSYKSEPKKNIVNTPLKKKFNSPFLGAKAPMLKDLIDNLLI